MRTQANTPFIKAEQFVHVLANGQYFFEVLIWIGLSTFISIMIWLILKKTILVEKNIVMRKGNRGLPYLNNKN